MKSCGGCSGLNKIIDSVDSAGGLYTIFRAVGGAGGIATLMKACEGPRGLADIHAASGGSDGVAQNLRNVGGQGGLAGVSDAIGRSDGLAKVVGHGQRRGSCDDYRRRRGLPRLSQAAQRCRKLCGAGVDSLVKMVDMFGGIEGVTKLRKRTLIGKSSKQKGSCAKNGISRYRAATTLAPKACYECSN